MAFAAQLGSVPRLGSLLFVSAVVWGVIYDTQYAMVDREDDLKIGVRSTAILFGDLDRGVIAALQVLFFWSLVLVGESAQMGAWYYAGLSLAAVVALYQQFLINARNPDRCFRAFLKNAWLGGFVFCGVVLDYLFRGST